jgi:hypothetical protein
MSFFNLDYVWVGTISKIGQWTQEVSGDSEENLAFAVYAKSLFINEKKIAFIMAGRLIHESLELNPHAAYLFVESKEKYAGKRLYLTKMKEEENSELIDQIRRKDVCPVDEGYKKGKRFLVYFKTDKILPLVGVK